MAKPKSFEEVSAKWVKEMSKFKNHPDATTRMIANKVIDSIDPTQGGLFGDTRESKATNASKYLQISVLDRYKSPVNPPRKSFFERIFKSNNEPRIVGVVKKLQKELQEMQKPEVTQSKGLSQKDIQRREKEAEARSNPSWKERIKRTFKR